ncbi:unnamed protein product [Symbiodinium microadriaticum]|nr:unnamed protein product [Symbiodinium microadriaticum]
MVVASTNPNEVLPWLQTCVSSTAASAVFDRPPVDQWPAYASWSQLEEGALLNAFMTHAVDLSKECVSLKTGGGNTSADQCLSRVGELSEAVVRIKETFGTVEEQKERWASFCDVMSGFVDNIEMLRRYLLPPNDATGDELVNQEKFAALMTTFKAMSLPDPSTVDFPEQNITDPTPPLSEFPELNAVNQDDLSALACQFQGPLDEAEALFQAGVKVDSLVKGFSPARAAYHDMMSLLAVVGLIKVLSGKRLERAVACGEAVPIKTRANLESILSSSKEQTLTVPGEAMIHDFDSIRDCEANQKQYEEKWAEWRSNWKAQAAKDPASSASTMPLMNTSDAPENADAETVPSESLTLPLTVPMQCDGNDQPPADAAEFNDEPPVDIDADGRCDDDQNRQCGGNDLPTDAAEFKDEQTDDKASQSKAGAKADDMGDDSLAGELSELIEAEYGAVQDSDPDRELHESESVPKETRDSGTSSDVDKDQDDDSSMTFNDNNDVNEPDQEHVSYSSHSFPPPPTSKHPVTDVAINQIQRVFGSAASHLDDHASFAKAVYNQESSTYQTFRAVLETLYAIETEFFILENVDMTTPDDFTAAGDGNFENVMQSLRQQGFAVKAYRMQSSDYGVPQRRIRLFFVGFNKKLHPNPKFDNIAKRLHGLKLKCQPPADFLLPAESSVVTGEISRREFALAKAEVRAENRKAKKETKDKEKDKDQDDDGIEKEFSKWKGVHMELAEKRSLV